MSRRALFTAFIALALAQAAVPIWVIVSAQVPLLLGRSYRFEVDLADPVDNYRGRYLALSFAERSVVALETDALSRGDTVYVSIEEGADGFARITGISPDRPASGDFVRVRIDHFRDARAHLDLPFDRYYMDEGDAERAERALLRAGEAAEAYAIVRVHRGAAVLTGVFLDGVPVEDLPADDIPADDLPYD